MQATSYSAIPAPVASLPLRVNFAWMLLGNFVQAGAQWGVVVVLARLGSPEDVGGYALALAIVSPVFLFSNMHLRTLLSTDVSLQTAAGAYFSLRLATSSAASLLLLAGALLQGPQHGLVLAGLTAAKAFEAVSELLYGEMQRTEQMDRIGKSMIVRWGGSLVVVLGTMYWNRGMLACLAGMAAVSAAVAASDVWAVQATRWSSSLRDVWKLAASAAPLGILMLMVSLNAAIPRYFLAGLVSQKAVGIFAALSYVSIALNTLVLAAGQAGGTAMARSFRTGEFPTFLRQSLKLLALAAALGLAGMAAAAWKGESLLLLLYGPNFAAESHSFLWLMLAGACSFVASAMGYILASVRCFHPQLPTLVATSSVTALCCHLWVPQSGVAGAAMAQTTGYAVQSALSVMLLGYFCERRFR